MRNRWLALAGFILLCLAAGAIGGWATRPAIADWYRVIAKPDWTPPDWLFAPVWTLLYVMMAVAAWLVWQSRRNVAPALALFFVQLALNLAWSLIFFGLRAPGLAALEIAALWVFIVLTMVAFFRRVTAAGLLFVPYLAWVSFAAALNVAIWRLN